MVGSLQLQQREVKPVLNPNNPFLTPSYVRITGAAIDEINGVYIYSTVTNDAKSFEHITTDGAKYTLTKCGLVDGGFKWFISRTTSDEEDDEDFYFCWATEDEVWPSADFEWHLVEGNKYGCSSDVLAVRHTEGVYSVETDSDDQKDDFPVLSLRPLDQQIGTKRTFSEPKQEWLDAPLMAAVKDSILTERREAEAAKQAAERLILEAEAERVRLVALEVERARLAVVELEAQKQRDADATRAAIEAEKARVLAVEAERVRLLAVEAERVRLAALQEAEKRLADLKEAESIKIEAAEIEKQRLAKETTDTADGEVSEWEDDDEQDDEEEEEEDHEYKYEEAVDDTVVATA
eukprot:gene29928-37061_t